MIPRVIHQIWLGGEPPQRERDWCDQWRDRNPTYTYHLWTEKSLPREIWNDGYVKYFLATGEKWAFIADRIRCLLLRDMGGIYIDADSKPVKTLDMLTHIIDAPHVDYVTGMRNPDRKEIQLGQRPVALHRGVSFVDNTVMMSSRNGRMINRLCDLYTPDSRKQSGYTMGLEVLRHADETIVLLGWRYFYATDIHAETVLLHDGHNLGSWCNETTQP